MVKETIVKKVLILLTVCLFVLSGCPFFGQGDDGGATPWDYDVAARSSATTLA